MMGNAHCTITYTSRYVLYIYTIVDYSIVYLYDMYEALCLIKINVTCTIHMYTRDFHLNINSLV